MRTFLLAATAMLLAPLAASPASAQAPAQPVADAHMADVLAHPRREEDRARDVHRNPAETLAFFRVQPGMTVVDYMPAGGWYSRVLIPYLGPQGTYVGLNPEVPDTATGFTASMRDTASSFPAQTRDWDVAGGAQIVGANAGDELPALAGSVDRFLIFREIHNMRRANWLHGTLISARRLLADDGLLGVVQHRAKADAPTDYVLGDFGYQREADVIALFSAYGFDLVEKSEINANPRDPANWPEGVWTLPPGYRGVGEDAARRAELDAIGESDRMTLLFRKRA